MIQPVVGRKKEGPPLSPQKPQGEEDKQRESSPDLLQHLSGKFQLVQLLLVDGHGLCVGLDQVILLWRPRQGRVVKWSAPAFETRGVGTGPTWSYSPVAQCFLAGGTREVFGGLDPPGDASGSSGRSLPAAHSPGKPGKRTQTGGSDGEQGPSRGEFQGIPRYQC